MELSFNVKRNVSFGGQTVSDYISGLGVEKIKVLSEAEYAAIATPDEKTMYLVQNTNGIKFYLGSVSLYADDVPADVEQELRRIAGIAETNRTSLESVVVPTMIEHGQAIQTLQTLVQAIQNQIDDMVKIVTMTEAEYAALDNPDEQTLYILT